VNKIILKQLEEYDGQLQVTCDLSPGHLVEWYNIKTKAIISTKGSLKVNKSVQNCEEINVERV
jgi:hypothetical protein